MNAIQLNPASITSAEHIPVVAIVSCEFGTSNLLSISFWYTGSNGRTLRKAGRFGGIRILQKRKVHAAFFQLQGEFYSDDINVMIIYHTTVEYDILHSEQRNGCERALEGVVMSSCPSPS